MLAPAFASGGPYTVGARSASVYVGVEAERITRLAGAEGSYADSVMDVDDGLSKTGVKAIVSYGLFDHTELELTLPYGVNHLNRVDGPLCTALGEACTRTSGFAPLQVRVKQVLLDELTGAPLSLAVAAEARYGGWTWATRDRLTNLGLGTFDAGGGIGFGRSGALGPGFWALSGSADARWRTPLTEVDGAPVPGWETDGAVEVLFAPRGAFAFGPEVAWFFRPQGTDVETSDFADPDWIGALAVQKVAVGGSAHLRARQGVTLSASVFHNVWAVNNPVDALVVTTGVQVSRLSLGRARP